MKGHVGNKGVTLVELMVVLVIVGLLISSLFGTFSTQKSSSTRQSSIQQVQQDGRLVLTMIKRDVMAAGYGTNNEISLYVVDGGNGPDKLFVNDTNFLSPEELLNEKYGHVAVLGSGTDIQISEIDLDSDGENEFIDAQWQTVITDDNSQKWNRIDALAGKTLTLAYAVNANFLAPAIYYCVDLAGTDNNCPTGGGGLSPPSAEVSMVPMASRPLLMVLLIYRSPFRIKMAPGTVLLLLLWLRQILNTIPSGMSE